MDTPDRRTEHRAPSGAQGDRLRFHGARGAGRAGGDGVHHGRDALGTSALLVVTSATLVVTRCLTSSNKVPR